MFEKFRRNVLPGEGAGAEKEEDVDARSRDSRIAEREQAHARQQQQQVTNAIGATNWQQQAGMPLASGGGVQVATPMGSAILPGVVAPPPPPPGGAAAGIPAPPPGGAPPAALPAPITQVPQATIAAGGQAEPNGQAQAAAVAAEDARAQEMYVAATGVGIDNTSSGAPPTHSPAVPGIFGPPAGADGGKGAGPPMGPFGGGFGAVGNNATTPPGLLPPAFNTAPGALAPPTGMAPSPAFHGFGAAPTPYASAPAVDLVRLQYRVDNLNTVVRWMAPEHRDLIAWSTPVKFFVGAATCQLGIQSSAWVAEWKASCAASKGKPGGTPLGHAPIYFGSRFIQYVLGMLQRCPTNIIPASINQKALADWADTHSRFTTVAEWKSSIQTCIVSAKNPRFQRGKGGPAPGAENRVLFQFRPQYLMSEEWKPAMIFINQVLVPHENGEIAEGQGLLPAERALWE